ncbi:hypothetical protein CH63R_14554 [Colletotrichum higginsianum IMI 349063]|uniref:Uncharacterized protein n=1 Tax=Colletotrichum higginsianum (strain IMI 349063) TaxID=759273 RepID=A0A1B7XQD8_COLHI|nr:hypothetical protein CH63R_14554 [Colletotrichum higginsianum IMI 349063]OBR01982.1 hypothetical protein CH63R_14554 [Colletotrichum higginsianum IMI 349063]
MFGRSRSSSSSASASASSGREGPPPDYHAIRFTISLPCSSIKNSADKSSEQRDQDREERRGRQQQQQQRRRQRQQRRNNSQSLNLCFHGDWVPTRGTLELHFDSEGIQTSLAGQDPPVHEEDARVLTLECNRVFISVGLYFAAITLINVAVETYIYYNRSALRSRSMEPRWRNMPLLTELGRVALLYGNAAPSLVDLAESAAPLLLSDIRENILPLCRHAAALKHIIEAVCGEYNAILTDAVGSLAALQIQASSWIVAGAIDGMRVKGLLSC